MAAQTADNLRIREIVGFHCQQAAEKYLKALLRGSSVSDALSRAKWLTPFGVGIRYPGDTAEMLPGDEAKAIELAEQVWQVVLAILNTG